MRFGRLWDLTMRKEFPYRDGDFRVLGPEIFASDDGEIICWKGENYVKQSRLPQMDSKSFAPIHLANGDSVLLTYTAIHAMVLTGVTFHIRHEPPMQMKIVVEHDRDICEG